MISTTIVFVEHVLWDPGDAWDEALDHLASRFARAAPLDTDAIRAAGALHEQLELLVVWASQAGASLDRELGRWFDEHLSMHVRPAPTVTRAVRSLAGTGRLHGASALPTRAAESIVRHAGCFRSLEQVHGDVRSAHALDQLASSVDARSVIASAPTPLPAGLERRPLARGES